MTATIQKNSREELRVSRQEYKGHDVVSVRVWFTSDDGDKRPSKKGVALNATLLPDIQRALAQVAQDGGA